MSYDDGQFRSVRRRVNPGSAARWALTVVVAAAVGSGATLAVVISMLHAGLLTTAPIAALQPAATSGKIINETVNVTVNDGVVQAVKKVTPSVVGVINWQRIPNANGIGQSLQEYGVGSGVIFSRRGYIVTNNHVVEGASRVEVVLYDKKHVYAQIVGTDAYTDLAVLKIPASDVSPQNVAAFGNSDTLQPGEPAIAIGNPAGLDFDDTVTVGVISATSRTMPVTDVQTGQMIGEENVLQTDAAINPGNSGGPLCNILGQVVGINSSKIVATGFEGMGFAIPINEVKLIAGQIIQYGHAEHPAIGVEVMSLSQVPQEYAPNAPVNYGVFVVRVTSAEARRAGLVRGDVIVAVNGRKVTDFTSLQQTLWAHYKPGDTVALTVYRGRRKMTLHLTLGVLPAYKPLPLQPQQPNSGSPFANPFGGGSGGSGSGGSGGSSGGSFSLP